MTLQTTQQFSTMASGVTLACGDRITGLQEILPVLKIREP